MSLGVLQIKQQGLIEVPDWLTKAWYPLLMCMLVAGDFFIPRTNRTLIHPAREVEQVLERSMVLSACLSLGRSSLADDCHLKLEGC